MNEIIRHILNFGTILLAMLVGGFIGYEMAKWDIERKLQKSKKR